MSTDPARRTTSLVDVLDRTLQRGVAVRGEIILSIADVDLVLIDLRALLASVDALDHVTESRTTTVVVDERDGDDS